MATAGIVPDKSICTFVARKSAIGFKGETVDGESYTIHHALWLCNELRQLILIPDRIQMVYDLMLYFNTIESASKPARAQHLVFCKILALRNHRK